ncbi:UNVERIFIED_CONTAM: Receptor-like protein kinase [Sesamum radiatum]|uniref:Receptor-like protein kinase n=1 Tax=Sesamum radiatum TaxID=300843 RepID=A0AAW2M6S3_SESRA
MIPGALGNCSGLTTIDLSLNSLTGEIPPSFQNLATLEGLLLSDNHITGVIPPFLGNFSNLRQFGLDNNNISGEIPSNIGLLKELTLFFAWQNELQGKLPNELANCQKLQDLDLSNNALTGPVPRSLFNLRNLTKLLLISNQLSGKIPADIGNCSSLTRLRLGSNMLDGEIPSEIGMLGNLRFLELSENQFTGKIPPDIGNCKQLEMVDLHGNKLQGVIPLSFVSLLQVNVLDLSMNQISGNIPESMGNLTSLNKLVLSGNKISGSIPRSLGRCKNLQLLDVSSNSLSGSIPEEIGDLQELDILLNLSANCLTGPIPESFSNFSKLDNMDISHNMLVGSLQVLSNLDNLVSLNVSYNNFSGSIPNIKFFQDLPNATFAGNKKLCFTKSKCHSTEDIHRRKSVRNLTILVVIIVIIASIIVTAGTIFYSRARETLLEKSDEEKELQWDFTPFQKLNFTVEDVVTKLSDSNIVGRGCSGVVYRIETPTRQFIAVKKLWPKKKGEIPQRDLFSAEVTTLGSIRHKNIVRLLGCCENGKTRLLLFDYISNGSLAGLLHGKKILLDWNARYNIIMGAAQGLAYLHHDCIPPIVHRDIKTNNILVGPLFEAFLADFGLAKLVSSPDSSRASDIIAGSYGYIAPEYGYSLKITEKSDVYSYGIVLLEVLTGMEPTDSQIPDGKHIVTWVYEELRERHRDFTSIVDQQLLLHSGTQTEEMLQVLG